MRNQMRPVHPGEILKAEFLNDVGMSPTALAHALGVPPNRITGIVNGDRSITADTALRLARYLGTSPEFWMNLQSAYDLRTAERDSGKAIEREVSPRAA
jgi:antitoxin HigA-1